MSPEANKPPGKVATFFRKVASLPRRFLRLSLPTHAAILTTLFLLVVVITVFVYFLRDPASVPWRHVLSFGRVVLVLFLLVLIPYVVYKGLRLWLEGEPSRYPDLDFAWKAGLDALRRAGLSIDSIPIFLILGSTGDEAEAALMDASRLGWRVREVPQGPAPLHWYANPEGIYLFCTDASWLSGLATVREKRAQAAAEMADAEAPPPVEMAAAEDAGGADSGTMMLEQYVAGQVPAGSMGEPGGGDRGTMMLQSPFAAETGVPAVAYAPAQSAVEEQAAVLPPHEAAEQMQRLEYVCQLLRRARQPLCAINGVLTLLPLRLVAGRAGQVEELQRAVKADLLGIQRVLRLRCPVTALVTGMEDDRGFRELVRRVGRDRAASQRFGRRFDVRSPSTPEQLAALCIHVVGAFEDWVYTLFREKDALTRPGNTRLYALLCMVRARLLGRLRDILRAGYGYDARQQPHDDPFPFSGCYFAATGDTEDRQAFVGGVLHKLVDEQEHVEWTRRAVAADRRYLGLAYAGFLVAGVAAVSLAGMVVYHAFFL